ncbi:MAG: CocE/NonD family hydrolase [Anaerolineae bacterium]
MPTLRPTATPVPGGALEGLLFAITLNDRLLATEVLHTRLVDGGLLVESTVTWVGRDGPAEHRSALLSPILYPISYSYDRRTRGVSSWWVAQREGGVVNTLSNNLAWFGPVQQSDISPAPGVMLERSPSALPLALLALQFTDGRTVDQLTADYRVPMLDVTDDIAYSRQLTLSVSEDQGNAVIGTLALEGRVSSAPDRSFTLWMRPDTRQLFRAEFPQYRFGFWEQLRDASLREPGLLRIERVSSEPLETTPVPRPQAEMLFLEGSDGQLSGLLYRPQNVDRAPALLLRRGWDQPDLYRTIGAWVQRGWAVFVVDPAGVGASEGAFQRAPDDAAAADMILAARVLATAAGIDPERIVLVGCGDSAVVSLLALASPGGDDATVTDSLFSAAVLGAFATDGPLIPDLAADRVLSLASYHGWSQEETATYLEQSIGQWDVWQAQAEGALSFLGRRVSLVPLSTWSQVDLSESLRQANVPVLVLHGAGDEWTPPDGAARLVDRVWAAGVNTVTYREVEGVGHDLGRDSGRLWAESVDAVAWEWLAQQ